jgi:hypothetical protein
MKLLRIFNKIKPTIFLKTNLINLYDYRINFRFNIGLEANRIVFDSKYLFPNLHISSFLGGTNSRQQNIKHTGIGIVYGVNTDLWSLSRVGSHPQSDIRQRTGTGFYYQQQRIQHGLH